MVVRREILDMPRFLACASHYLRAFNDAIRLAENEVDLFINPEANGETTVQIF